jgi:hypothetical protein
MSIDPAGGLIQWTPSAAQTGDHPVEVKVQDAGGLSATQPFTITVAAVAVCVAAARRPDQLVARRRQTRSTAPPPTTASPRTARPSPRPGRPGLPLRRRRRPDPHRQQPHDKLRRRLQRRILVQPDDDDQHSTPNQVLLAKGRYLEGGFNAPVAIQVLGGDGRLLVRMPPAPALVSSTNTWPAGTWQHIALSWDGARYRLYVNGSEEAGLDNAFSISTAPTRSRSAMPTVLPPRALPACSTNRRSTTAPSRRRGRRPARRAWPRQVHRHLQPRRRGPRPGSRSRRDRHPRRQRLARLRRRAAELPMDADRPPGQQRRRAQ